MPQTTKLHRSVAGLESSRSQKSKTRRAKTKINRKELDLDFDLLPLERAFGVHGCVESDCFQFAIVLQDKPCTRRVILLTVSSIFDPLGFVSPLLLDGKSILQELCRHEVGWDDPIPDKVKVKWEKWRSYL